MGRSCFLLVLSVFICFRFRPSLTLISLRRRNNYTSTFTHTHAYDATIKARNHLGFSHLEAKRFFLVNRRLDLRVVTRAVSQLLAQINDKIDRNMVSWDYQLATGAVIWLVIRRDGNILGMGSYGTKTPKKKEACRT